MDRVVSIGLLGVLAVLAIIGLVLLFTSSIPSGAIIGTYAPECTEDSDCDGHEYCGQIGTTVRCMPRFKAGARCFRDQQCSSNRCSKEGYCY